MEHDGGQPLDMIAIAITNTGTGDAFRFLDRDGCEVWVEQVHDESGSQWRLFHTNKGYVLPFAGRNGRLHAISLLRQYLHKHVSFSTLQLLPGQAPRRLAGAMEIVEEAWV